MAREVVRNKLKSEDHWNRGYCFRNWKSRMKLIGTKNGKQRKKKKHVRIFLYRRTILNYVNLWADISDFVTGLFATR